MGLSARLERSLRWPLDKILDRRVQKELVQADELKEWFQEQFETHMKNIVNSTQQEVITQQDVIDRLAERVISREIKVSVMVRMIDDSFSGLEHRLVEEAMYKVQRTRGSHY